MTATLGALVAGLGALGLVVIALSMRPAPLRERGPLPGPDGGRLGRLLPWFAAQFVVTGVMWFISGWPALGLGVGAFVWVAYLWLETSRERRHYHRVTEAISVWVDMVKDALAGGAGLSQAIEATVSVAPEAIRPAVTRLASRQRTGSQTAALWEFGTVIAHPTGDLVVLALVAASENQARDLPQLLAKTAEQARTRNEAVIQIETERSKLYTEARAMVLSIALLGVIISLIARDFLEPYSRPLGQVVLGAVMALVVGSSALLVAAGRPQPDKRLIADPGSRLGAGRP